MGETVYFDVQRRIVAHMTASNWREAPHCGVSYETDLTNVLNVLADINSTREKADRITVNTLFLKMLTEGIKRAPMMNAHLKFNRHVVLGEVTPQDSIDISVPMICSNGKMMTITMKDFGNKNMDQMQAYIADVRRRMDNTNMEKAMVDVCMENIFNDLRHLRLVSFGGHLLSAVMGKAKPHMMNRKEKAEYAKIPDSDKITKDDIRQGTITISNIGSVYRAGKVKTTILDLIAPQTIVICIDAIATRDVPVEKDGVVKLEKRKFASFLTAFDHRAVDYEDLVPMYEELDRIVDNPDVIREWVDH